VRNNKVSAVFSFEVICHVVDNRNTSDLENGRCIMRLAKQVGAQSLLVHGPTSYFFSRTVKPQC
jgi:hypothetical protein